MQAAAATASNVETWPDDGGTSEDLRERLKAVIGDLRNEADRRVNLRRTIEQRWILDLLQYHGRYDPDQRQKITEIDGSSVFVNYTRPKTNALIARLFDLLFPTDDKNWGIQPTPVPELAKGADKVGREVFDATAEVERFRAAGEEAANRNHAPGKVAAEIGIQAAEQRLSEAKAAQEELQSVLDEARDRADLMAEEIDDQLKQSRYAAECRELIEDACKIGTGVLKGPVVGLAAKQRWERDEAGGYRLVTVDDNAPAMQRVDPWHFFPEIGAARIEDSDSFYERHLMTAAQMRRFARRSDVDKDALRRVLRNPPRHGDQPQYLVDLFDVTGQQSSNVSQIVPRYTVWEYTGSLEPEQVAFLARSNGQEQFADDMQDADPLDEVYVRIWFCDNELLAISEHPLDSNEPLYSVFNIERDESSVFGFGVPYLMRDEQSVLNAAWRMMMDNSGKSVGPQIIVNQKAVQPRDGSSKLYPFKIWDQVTPITGQAERPFWAVHFDSHQAELANIIAIAREQIDDVTSMPSLAQGEPGADVTKTFQGMALLMNSANVVFRRIVRYFDDGITVPSIRRLYHFNMQFSEKEAIKGDYEVDARGSSVLLVRELQSQNLLMMLQFVDHPTLGPALRPLELLKEVFKAGMLSAGQFVVADTEYEEAMANRSDPAAAVAEMEAAEREKDREIKREEIEAQIAAKSMEQDVRLRTAQLQYDAALIRAAEDLNMDVEKLQAQIAEQAAQREAKAAERRSKERIVAAEISEKQRTGDSAGGTI